MLNTIQIDENLVCACYVEEDNNLCGNTSQGSYAMVCHQRTHTGLDPDVDKGLSYIKHQGSRWLCMFPDQNDNPCFQILKDK